MTRNSRSAGGLHPILRMLAIVAGGSWGAVAGACVLGFGAAGMGVPSGTESGELIPGLGWNSFTAFLIGMPIGFAVGATVAQRGAHRWPRLIGVPIAIVGVLAMVTAVADPSGWDSPFYLFVVPMLTGAVILAWRRRHRDVNS